MEDLEKLKWVLTDACERGRAARVTNRLPDPPAEWIKELTFRLEGINLVAYDRGAVRKKRPPKAGTYCRGTRVNPAGDGTLSLFDTSRPESIFKRMRDPHTRKSMRWAVVCEKHQQVLRAVRLKDATAALSRPEFCDDCAVLLPKREF